MATASSSVYMPDDADMRQDSVDYLRSIFPPGAEVRTIVTHVSRSGMLRSIRVLAIRKGTGSDPDRIVDVTRDVARVVGWRLHRDGGIVVHGCGMDMCFHVVYTLSRIIYADHPFTERETSMYGTDAGYLLTSRPL